MTTDIRADADQLFVALISYVPPVSFRESGEYDSFDTIDDARKWAADQVRESVGFSGSAWDFRADIALVDRADYENDSWGVADHPVARATWDHHTDAVIWQNDGPFTFDDDNND